MTDRAVSAWTIERYALRCYPADDRRFEADAAEAFARTQRATRPERLLEEFQRSLVDAYPSAVVREQHPLSVHGGTQLVYCYRDGRYAACADQTPPGAAVRPRRNAAPTRATA